MNNTGFPPGVSFVVMRHDALCPALESENTLDCTCKAEFELTTARRFVDAVARTRAERRKAEREAAKAMRRAARAGKR